MAAGFDEDRPAHAEPAECVVEPRRDADQFSRCGAVEVRSAEARRALEAAVLVEDDAFAGQRRPRQEIREALRLVAIFEEIEHHATSRTEMGRIAHVPTHYLDEQRIALRGPDSRHMAARPQHEPRHPPPKAPPHSGPNRARTR